MTTESEDWIIAMRAAAAALSPLTDAEKAQAAAAKEAAEKLAKLNSALNNTKDAIAKFGGAMATGDTSLKNLAASFDLIDAAGQKTLKGLLKEGSKWIPIIGTAIKAVTAGEKMLLGELDALGKTFNEFGQIGALGSKGMQGLIDDFDKSGLTMAIYKKVVSENTVALARFKGSVKDGISSFTDLTNVLTTLDKDGNGIGQPLRMLGLNLEEVAESAASYVALQTRLGYAQTMSNNELARGTVAYQTTLSELSKVTGTNVKTLKAQQDAAMSETRFRSKIVLENDQVQAESALKLNSMIEGFAGPEAAQAFRDIYASGGAALTDASKALVLSAPGIQDAIMKFQNKQITAEELTKGMQAGLKSTETQRAQYGSVRGDGVYLKFAKSADFVRADLSKLGTVAAETANQISGVDDPNNLTKNIVSAQQAIETMSILIQKGINKTLPNAAKIVSGFTESITKAVKLLLKLGQIDSSVDGTTDRLSRSTEEGAWDSNDVNQPYNVPSNSFRRRREVNPNEAAGNQAEPAAPAASSRSSSGTIRGTPAATSDLSHPSGPSGPLSVAPKTKDPAEQGIKDAVLAKKTQLENLLGKKLVVTSGFRAGSKNHGSGDAIDLGLGANRLSEIERNKLIKSAIDLGFTGIGAEYNAEGGPHIHLDTSHGQLVGWGSDYTSKTLGIDSPYAAALINARRSGQSDPALASAANGGVLSGPRSGYSATLHGTEAVVPLPDGRSIPVSNPGGGGSMEIQAAQLNALEELVSAMKNQVNISSKMLQYAQ